MPRIFIIDETADMLDLFKMLLEEKKYEVQTSLPNRDVAERAVAFGAELLILDLGREGQKGREMLKQLKGNRCTRKLPVVLVSTDSLLLDEYASNKTDGVVEKPFNIGVLYGVVENLLVHNGSA